MDHRPHWREEASEDKVRRSWLLRELTPMGRDGLGHRHIRDPSRENSEERQKSESVAWRREGVCVWEGGY